MGVIRLEPDRIRPVFITFEGPEGAGKSTAIRSVAEALSADGWSVTVTREPGSGDIGARIRAILLDPNHEPLHPLAELFLFLADRAQHLATVIEPALAKEHVVLCDRYGDSTIVYQGYARGLNLDMLRDTNRVATGGRSPDLTLLFDLPAAVGLARLQDHDRLDAQPLSFHESVRAGFLAEAERDPRRWRILDASLPHDVVLALALKHIGEFLGPDMSCTNPGREP